MYCGLYSTLIVSAVASWQMFSFAYGKLGDLKDPSKIFHEHHTAVVTVVADGANRNRTVGTGFSIDAKEHLDKETGTKHKFVITASHVVKGARHVGLVIYQDEKDSDGNRRLELCPAKIYGLDIVRDVAALQIACDTCDCTRLGALQTHLSNVNDKEAIFIIGESANGNRHSFIHGRLSSTNFTFSLASLIYKQPDKHIAVTTLVTRVHGLARRFGDSGSAVMDKSGHVIGMISAISEGHNYCVTMEEISKAYKQILDTVSPHFVGCTAHESVFLGRTYWGDRSGKSIKEMNALATAMDAQYFAVAHDGLEAHAFTFHALWWEILPGNDDMKEDASQCRCEMNSFTDGQFLQRTKDSKVMCGCSENACRRNPLYKKRFGEDNDRRWAVYKRMSDKNRHYVPSKESLHMMEDIADEIDYWKEKADILTREKDDLVSENKLRIAVVIAVALCVASSLAFYLYNRCKKSEHRCKNSKRLLREANAKCAALEERLSQQDELQNPTNAPTQESNVEEESP